MAKVKKQYVDDGSGNKELFYPATISDAVKFPDNSETLTERLSHLSKEDCEDFRWVIIDGENHVLLGIKDDGSVEWSKGMPAPIKKKLKSIIDDLTSLTEKQNADTDDIMGYLTVDLEGKSISIIGDSLSTFDGYINGNLTYYPIEGNDVTSVEQTWWMKLINETNAKLEVNNSYSGSTVHSTSYNSYITRSSSLGAPSYIIIHGGTNDMWNSTSVGELHFDKADDELNVNQFADAYDFLVRKITSLYPSASIISVIPHIVSDDFAEAIKSVVKHYGLMGCVDLRLYSSQLGSGGHYQDAQMTVVKDAIVKVLFANKNVLKENGKSLVNADVAKSLSCSEINDYLAVEIDADTRLLSATYLDGSHYVRNIKSETIPMEFDHTEDPEGRMEVTEDADGKVIGYRDSEGTRHENKISVNHLALSDDAANEVNEAFKSAGIKMENPSDFSKDSHIELPIPRIAAQVKIYAQRLPMSKTDDISAKLEYLDKDGNCFAKNVVLNSQGSSSMGYIDPVTGERGNLSIDIADGTLITFGNWVSQDSFHLKKYYIDVFRGQCIVGYRLTEQVYKSRPIGKQYPYEKYISNSDEFSGLGTFDNDFNTGAKCHPEGFPIHIDFIKTSTGETTDLGVYTWNLKKSKEVYYMNKKKATNILLDGIFNGNTLWEGKIDWGQFEIRNPKSLIDINGNKYDGDNPKELSDTDANSKKVKDSLVRLSKALSDIKNNLSKETFEKYFLVNPFIDYIVISQIIYNKDGFDKNWIWTSWDGLLFTPTLYDLDSIFGSESSGIETDKKSEETILGMEQYLPSYYLQTLYSTEIASRYKELRDNGIFSVANIMNLLNDWLRTITYKYLKEDIEKYNETPSYRESCISDKWNYLSYNWTSNTDYDATKTYNAGEQCRYYGCLFSAKESVTGVAPLTKLYDTKPRVLGYYNSPMRVKNWLEKRIAYLDKYYNYK